jgi:phage terminase large subunit-like protein
MRNAGAFNAPTFSIKQTSIIRPDTRRWLRTAGDEQAAENGAFFDEAAGKYAVDWIQDHCCLYEGDRAGYPIDLEDWQYETIMQLFGWKITSNDPRWQGQQIRRFRNGHIWIAKKNGKSPTSAAIGCYMLIGDGEQGQHVFSAASDGVQAGIAHQHAINMIQQSPDLSPWCSIHRQTGEIKYELTQSTYSIAAGRNTKGQQGLNGSVLIDEVHVVSTALYDTLQYAGISRKEPLLLTFSTAGDDVSSLGYDLYNKSIKIRDGRLFDPTCFVTMFGATEHDKNPLTNRPLSPEDWYNEEVVRPIAIKSNPAIGRTLSEDELLNSWRSATRSVTELARWKKYRASVWTAGESGWLDPSDWVKNTASFTYEDMYAAKAPCVVAVDLSKTGDTTSLTATFAIKDGENFIPHQITWGWIPEATAIRKASQDDIQFEQWVNNVDNLTICKGHRTVQYKDVAAHVGWLMDYFDLRAIGYDVWNSSEFANELITGYGVDEDMLYKIPQSMPIFAPFTTFFEKKVLDGQIRYPNSPYMQWQFGNVQLVYDASNNYKPSKPEKGSVKTIDGVVTSIMSNGLFHLPQFHLTNTPLCSVTMLAAGDKR